MHTYMRTLGLPALATCAAAALLSGIGLAPAAASTTVTPKISEHSLSVSEDGLLEPGARSSSAATATVTNRSHTTNLPNVFKAEGTFDAAGPLTALGTYSGDSATEAVGVVQNVSTSDDARGDSAEAEKDSGAPVPDMSAGVKDKTEDGITISAITDVLDVPDTRSSVVGITYEGATDVAFEVRTKSDGEWSSWTDLDREDGEGGVDGTEPFVVNGATDVQLRVLGSAAPAKAKLLVIDPKRSSADDAAVAANAPVLAPTTSIETTEEVPTDEDISDEDLEKAKTAGEHESSPKVEGAEAPAGSSADAASEGTTTEAAEAPGGVAAADGTTPAANAATVNYVPGSATVQNTSVEEVPMPDIGSRASWGADESLRGSPSYASRTDAAVIHHTAGSNSYSATDVPGILRGIYSYHTQGRGWSDVGYNVLADKYGRLWEGRAGGLDKNVIGAHVANYNSGTFGVSVMGSYDSSAPPQETLDAVAHVIAWKLSLNGVSAKDWTTVNGKKIRTVSAHRDIGATTCPGDAFYAKMDAIRDAVSTMQDTGIAAGAPQTMLQKSYMALGTDLGKAYGNEFESGSGYAQVFQNGLVFYRHDLGAVVVRGGILGRYQGAMREILGFPISQEITGLKDGGVVQKFEKGTMHWSPNTDAYYTSGGLQSYWGSKGYEKGHLGYPTSDPECNEAGDRCEQTFEGARLVWANGRGVTEFSLTGEIGAGATDLGAVGAKDLGK